ncbi:MAG: hypothetical protein AAGH15_10170 [Myxococcota bacterium]
MTTLGLQLRESRDRLTTRRTAFVTEAREAASDFGLVTRNAFASAWTETKEAGQSLATRTRDAGLELIGALREEATSVKGAIGSAEARPALPEVPEPNVGAIVKRVDQLAIDLQKKALGTLQLRLGQLSVKVDGELERLDAEPEVAPEPKKKKAKAKKTKKAKTTVREGAPWEGYDAMTAKDIAARLLDADGATRSAVASYEKKGKKRKTVLEAAIAKAS